MPPWGNRASGALGFRGPQGGAGLIPLDAARRAKFPDPRIGTENRSRRSIANPRCAVSNRAMSRTENHRVARQDETELITRALAHDADAVREIVQANNRRLYRIARGVVKDDGEAEDVVQAAY